MSTRCLSLLIGVWLLGQCSGCSTTKLKLTSLDPFNIDPPRPEVMDLHPPEAVWWLDDKQHIHLAMYWKQKGLMPLLPNAPESKFILVYRSDQPFNGLAANLRVDPKALRMVLNSPGQENYFSSQYGVLGVRRQGDLLTGSLRVWVGQQNYDFILGGWTRPAPFLILGDFSAQLNPARTADLTMELGGEPPPPATQPASAPASQPASQPAAPTTSTGH